MKYFVTVIQLMSANILMMWILLDKFVWSNVSSYVYIYPFY